MDVNDQKINELKQIINTAEESLESAKRALAELTGEDYQPVGGTKPGADLLSSFKVTNDGQVIEGIFNGENMLGPEGKIFPVPANYASKSKLVEGDRLKLTIAEDGSFIFKQIGPIERKSLIGTLAFENNAYHVTAEGKTYNVLYASVSYFKAKPGDKVTIVVPASEQSNWGALENIIHEVPGQAEVTEASTDSASPTSDEVIKDFFSEEEGADKLANLIAPELPAQESSNTEEVKSELSLHEKVIPVPDHNDNQLSDLPDFPDLDQVPADSNAPEAPATATNNFFDTMAQAVPAGLSAQTEPTVTPPAGLAQESSSSAPVALQDKPAEEAKELDI